MTVISAFDTWCLYTRVMETTQVDRCLDVWGEFGVGIKETQRGLGENGLIEKSGGKSNQMIFSKAKAISPLV